MRHTLMAVIRAGAEGGYVAECAEDPVVTQGATLDETLANLKEAVELYLADEDPADLGFAGWPTVIVTMEVEPEHA